MSASERARRTQLKGTLIIVAVWAIPALLLAAVTWLLKVPLMGPVAALVLALALYLLLRGAEPALLDRVGAAPIAQGEAPRAGNLLEGLALSAGIAEPELFVVDDPATNIAAVGPPVGRAGGLGTIVITAGALKSLNRVELEGLLAQQVAHLISKDARLTTILWRLMGSFGLGGLAQRFDSSQRELVLDREAVGITRYPPGLIGALGKVASRPAVQCPIDTYPLWTAPPRAGQSLPGSAELTGSNGRAPIDQRIAILRDF